MSLPSHQLGDRRPWYRRPGTWWILAIIPFSTAAMSATLAPRVEIYTRLVCRVHKPDIFKENYGLDPASVSGIFPPARHASPIISPDDKYPEDTTRILLELNRQRPLRCRAPERTKHEDVRLGPCGPAYRCPAYCRYASSSVPRTTTLTRAAALSLSMGAFACLTTGWWGSYSDRHGRTSVMGISILGALLTDFIVIFVATFPDAAPGGYWFLVARLAHTSQTRARQEAVHAPSLFHGHALHRRRLGPSLGGLLIRETSLISIFYATTLIHISYTLYVWFVLPESAWVTAVAFAIKLGAFLRPLAVFYPHRASVNGNPLKKPSRDWSLVLIALAYGFTASIMGSYMYSFQYASAKFGWTSEQLGYFLSSIGAVRAIYLTILVPVILKIFKPAPEILEFYQDDENAPLVSSGRPQVVVRKEIHSPLFDLRFARVCLLIEVIAYTGMALSPHPAAYTASAMGAAIGGALPAALQSVALDIYVRRGGTEAGKLFGAISVVQALSSQIAGPSMFALVYMNTVATFPAASSSSL
ncbi:hypothetical protein BD626DRAFT_569746 [Schizophyllum amplum]|uniref:Major facilitator superfamily domain-containing protein n=1 Tax=Schizophyllum amplum TaxID=97359 RepID=A0A550CCS8_9AGAR|nr:hypothetical protein BD626DRAFT_569746 [Auriculariopsis ampla]